MEKHVRPLLRVGAWREVIADLDGDGVDDRYPAYSSWLWCLNPLQVLVECGDRGDFLGTS